MEAVKGIMLQTEYPRQDRRSNWSNITRVMGSSHLDKARTIDLSLMAISMGVDLAPTDQIMHSEAVAVCAHLKTRKEQLAVNKTIN